MENCLLDKGKKVFDNFEWKKAIKSRLIQIHPEWSKKGIGQLSPPNGELDDLTEDLLMIFDQIIKDLD